MSFTSIQFLIFFPIVTLLYFIIKQKYRWIWLLITSYYFYMSWNPQYAVTIAFSTVITYLSGLLIEKANKISNEKQSGQLKKMWVFLSLFINLLILFFLKYYNFFTYSIARMLSYIHISIHFHTYDLLLPIGISFYTFQALSYTMDVYRNDVKAERNLGRYALFVSFFPQLVAGPIEKSKNLLFQFNEYHSFDYIRVKNGLLLILWGLFQKMIVADRLGQLVNTIYDNPSNYKGFEIIIATVFYAFQIYCDFSSYSDIARGAAEVLGFKLSRNFDRPYFSKSIKEFWRRWHMSLTGWFRDYLYIPLGGNRCSKLRNYFNIMVVFLVSGLWHGAAINFLVWGTLHGIYQIIGDVLKPVKNEIKKSLKLNTNRFDYKLVQVLVTFIMVDFAWIFFRAGTFTNAITLIKNMFYFNPWVFLDGSIFKLGLDPGDFLIALLSLVVIIVANLAQKTRSLRLEISQRNTVIRWSVYFTTIIIILIFGIYGPGYNPQQFIYSHF
ncbi:MAG: MBOAT family O-acyltransferase [Bacillota bacterium]|nr:MBOAT family O-acyltransferase [Bacillota bacterium]